MSTELRNIRFDTVSTADALLDATISKYSEASLTLANEGYTYNQNSLVGVSSIGREEIRNAATTVVKTLDVYRHYIKTLESKEEVRNNTVKKINAEVQKTARQLIDYTGASDREAELTEQLQDVANDLVDAVDENAQEAIAEFRELQGSIQRIETKAKNVLKDASSPNYLKVGGIITGAVTVLIGLGSMAVKYALPAAAVASSIAASTNSTGT